MPILHEHIEGKYEILGKLREGGMGAVYKVRHRLLDEVRVVKVLNPHLAVTPELSDRFLREARFAIQLRHPNIAQLHDFSIAEDGTAFIVMELIDGATLKEILAHTGPPPLGLSLEIARQTLKAIGFLHRRGFIHRDIAPDNLMLTRDPEGEPLVKLIDLGIAKVLKGGGTTELTSTGLFLGKPRYASPEQFGAEGSLGADARGDLYSFGVVFYELLTGVFPIQGTDMASLMAGHLYRPPVGFSESDPQGRIPSDLRETLLRVLAKSPEERFATAEDLSRRLSAVQDRFPVQPGDLEAVLLVASEPATAAPPQGSTQDKLDRQFAQGPTPAPTLRAGPQNPEATFVLAPAVPERTEVPAVPEIPTVRLEAPPPPLPPLPLLQIPPEETTPSIPAAVSQPAASERSRRRTLLPLAAALLLLVLAVVGFGIRGWRGSPSPVPPEQEASPAPSPEPEVTADNTSKALIPENRPEDPGLVGSSPAQAVLPAPTPTPAPVAPPPPRVEETPRRLPEKAVPAPPPVPAKKETPKPQPAPEDSPNPRKTPPEAPPDLTLRPKDLIVPGEDVPARLISVPPPVFPEEARGSGVYARILVAVRIDETGAVSQTKIARAYLEDGASSAGTNPGSPPTAVLSAFRRAAQEAASKARFEPAQRGGKPLPTWGELTFEFGKKPGG